MCIKMTKDRIEQLRAEVAKETKSYKYRFWNKEDKMEAEHEDERVVLTDVIVQPIITKAGKKEQNTLNIIFKDVAQINEWIESIKENTTILKNCQVLVQQSTRTESSMKDKIEDLMANIKSTSTKVRANLQALERRKDESEGESAINRVVDTQQTMLKKAFCEAIDDYQQSLLMHKKICEDIIKKQLQIVIQMVIRRVTCVPADRDVTQEEFDAILEEENTAVFVDNYMKETLEAKLILQDAQDRHKELLVIEREIKLVDELFSDLSLHVSRQGELIDKIEYHIQTGLEMTQTGQVRLSKAQKLAQKVRKKKMILALIVLILVLIILIILLV